MSAPSYDYTEGRAYVIYGKTTVDSIYLASITSNDGFFIEATGVVGSSQWTGVDVSSAGDANGDGLTDILVSLSNDNNNTGAAYLLYGTGDRSTTSVTLNSIAPAQYLF